MNRTGAVSAAPVSSTGSSVINRTCAPVAGSKEKSARVTDDAPENTIRGYVTACSYRTEIPVDGGHGDCGSAPAACGMASEIESVAAWVTDVGYHVRGASW